MKSDIEDYKITDLEKDKKTDWVGVRNYQARNFMRDDMSRGDLAFFYHSNGTPSGIAGIMEISSDAKPDPTQFDKKSKYYDEKATLSNPRWMLREVTFVSRLKNLLSIIDIREIPECKNMVFLQKGSRLSITPVTSNEWKALLRKMKQ